MQHSYLELDKTTKSNNNEICALANPDVNQNCDEKKSHITSMISNANRISDEDGNEGKVILYKRRFLVLAAFCLNSFMWSLTTNRHLIIATSYANYYNVSNELIGRDGDLGIDAITGIPSITVLLGFLVSALLIDPLGIKMMNVGIFGVTIGCWMWYLAFKSFFIAFASSILISLSGPFIVTSLLTVSNRFFPENERAKATATGTFFGLIGTGAAFGITPLYQTSDRVVNLDLKSCQKEYLTPETIQAAISSSIPLSCEDDQYDDAYDAFCCYNIADIDGLNLHLAIISTIIFLISLISVTNKPPTPPSLAAAAMTRSAPAFSVDSEGGKALFGQGMKSMQSVLKCRQFVQLNLADFFLTGGPEVVIATIARILPPSVASYNIFMIGGGIIVAIPSVLVTSILLDKWKSYFTFTSAAYIAATILWLISAICLTVANKISAIIFVITGGMSVIVYVVWHVTGFELKLEYCFRPDLAVEASVVAVDRVVVNISSLIFLAAIPPEIVGPANTLWISFGFMLFGDVLVGMIPNKRIYKRKKYEEDEQIRLAMLRNLS